MFYSLFVIQKTPNITVYIWLSQLFTVKASTTGYCTPVFFTYFSTGFEQGHSLTLTYLIVPFYFPNYKTSITAAVLGYEEVI